MKMRVFTLVVACLGFAAGCGEAPTTQTEVAETPAEAVVEVTPLKVTPIAFSEAGDPIVEFDTPGMHCGACAATIKKRLGEQETVVEVTTDADTKVVRVTFVKDGFDAAESMAAGEAVAAIAEAGFGEATPIEPLAETGDTPDVPAENAG